MDDSQIIDLFYSRDERAISETAGKYGRLLFMLAENITRDRADAEEVVNDTYLAVWENIPPHRPELLLPYLTAITRNLSFKLLEKKSATKRSALTIELTEELCDCISDGETVEKAYEAKELRRFIDGFVKGLEKEEQYLFIQRYYWARPIRDIAEELNESESKVKSALYRIRKKLSRKLAEADLI